MIDTEIPPSFRAIAAFFRRNDDTPIGWLVATLRAVYFLGVLVVGVEAFLVASHAYGLGPALLLTPIAATFWPLTLVALSSR